MRPIVITEKKVKEQKEPKEPKQPKQPIVKEPKVPKNKAKGKKNPAKVLKVEKCVFCVCVCLCLRVSVSVGCKCWCGCLGVWVCGCVGWCGLVCGCLWVCVCVCGVYYASLCVCFMFLFAQEEPSDADDGEAQEVRHENEGIDQEDERPAKRLRVAPPVHLPQPVEQVGGCNKNVAGPF